MTICVTPEQMRNALNKVQPRRVAVAYVGAGWDEIVCSDCLEEIILRPLPGSNPQAIEDLINKLGEDKVHFLNELHSKIFIGRGSVLFGSANLSFNGFSDGGNLEVGMYSDDHVVMDRLSEVFDEYIVAAKLEYPDRGSKVRQIERLKKQWRLSLVYGIRVDGDQGKSRSIDDYIIGSDKIHCVWWSGEVELNGDAVAGAGLAEDEITDCMLFRRDDQVAVGDWILAWRVNKDDGRPRRNANFSWVRVDKIIDDGVQDDEWSKLAVQIGKYEDYDVPFKIENELRGIIVEILRGDEFKALTVSSNCWSLAQADEITGYFLSAIKKNCEKYAA